MLQINVFIELKKEICIILSNICGGKIRGLKEIIKNKERV